MSPNLKRLPKGFTIYIFIIISFLLLFIPEDISNHIKLAITSPLAPVQKIISLTGNFFKNGVKKVVLIIESADETEMLQEKVFNLQNKIINQQNVINILNKKLDTVSEFRKGIGKDEKPLIANIIGYDASNFRRNILIDIGEKQGASIDDTVVFGTALVGRILAIGNSSSKVMLITDPASNVPSRFLKTRTQGIVKGISNNTCTIKYVPRHTEIKEGDKVISSGIGGIFPKSIYIGDVVEVKERSAQLFKEIKLKPRIDISKIEYVLVVKKQSSGYK